MQKESLKKVTSAVINRVFPPSKAPELIQPVDFLQSLRSKNHTPAREPPKQYRVQTHNPKHKKTAAQSAKTRVSPNAEEKKQCTNYCSAALSSAPPTAAAAAGSESGGVWLFRVHRWVKSKRPSRRRTKRPRASPRTCSRAAVRAMARCRAVVGQGRLDIVS